MSNGGYQRFSSFCYFAIVSRWMACVLCRARILCKGWYVGLGMFLIL